MLAAIVASTIMVVVTVFIHYECLQLISRMLERFGLRRRRAMLLVMPCLFVAHIIEITLYAVAFQVLALSSDVGQLNGVLADDFSDFLYFSFTCYSSLGLGDVYPEGAVRLLTGIEALNGLMLITWSASYSYLVMERLWGFPGGHGGSTGSGDRRD